MRLLLLIKSALLILVVVFLAACAKKNDKTDTKLKSQLDAVDSMYIAGKGDTAIILLKKVRSQLDFNDPLICDYYYQQVENFANNPKVKTLYADSGMAFFSSESRIKKYPKEYFNALMAKGDACLKEAKYISALNYYYECKKMLRQGICDNGDLSSKMGVIYYAQENFQLAGKYWAESYVLLGSCAANIPTQKMFFMKQGALDNAGVAYERAGMVDSANHYYLKDLGLINETESDSLMEQHYINTSRAVVYDNLGGLNLLKGNFAKAKDYLTQSLALYPPKDIDGSRIPPYIKLADLYMQMGDYAKAADAFKQSKLLLNRFYKDNPQLFINWNKLYARYLFKLNNTADAYRYQAAYIRLKDSLNNGLSELYRLDVVRELNGMQQQQTLTDFEQKDKLRRVSLAGIIIIAALFIVIIILIYRSLKKTRRNHNIVTHQNEQLQQTLSELELVNKNYIRILRVMAHDLRNPLSGMTGLAAMLLEDHEFSAENQHMLRLIENTGTHSMEMINELLKTGLADENEKIVKQRLDLRSLLYDSVELLQFQANDKQQQILFESDNVPVFAEVNHEKMWRVINNLIVNAIKFSHNNGVIKVGIKHDEKNILIWVADNGIGIPPEQKDTVFEMFTPAKKVGTDGEQPFGLGLSISKRIIEMHKGRIWFESNAGSGTTFYIELPYAD